MSLILDKDQDTQAERGEVMNDLVSGCLCLILAFGLAVVHSSQAGRLHDDFGRDPGPAFLPLILLSALALAGAGLVLRGGLRFHKSKAITNGASFWSIWPAALAVGLMCAFLPLRHFIEAAPALFFIAAALAVLAGHSGTARWPLTAVLGGISGFALYALFHFGLSVPL